MPQKPAIQLPVQVTFVSVEMLDPLTQEKVFMVSCPELQLGGSGKSKKEAEDFLRKMIRMSVGMAKRRGWLKDTLLSFGWTEKDGRLMPPEFQFEKASIYL